MKRWIVRLEAEERQRLEQMVRVGKAAAYKVRHANVLLALDASPGGPGLKDAEVSRALGITTRSTKMLRRRFMEQGLEACLARKQQEWPSVEPLFDGKKEAKLIALACGPAPEGRTRWTMELLADRVVALRVVEHCSDETVRRVLKKTS